MNTSENTQIQLKPSSEPNLSFYEHGIVTSLIKSVQFTFQSYFGMEPSPGAIEVAFKCGFSTQYENGLSGVLKMFQVTHDSTLIVSFSKETVYRLLSPLYKNNPAHDSSVKLEHSLRDGVGELTNVVYAYVKRYLNEKGSSFRMGIPIVQNTKDLTMEMVIPTKKTRFHSIMVPFTFENEGFLIELVQWKKFE